MISNLIMLLAGACIGFAGCALLSGKQYEKGYKDGFRAR